MSYEYTSGGHITMKLLQQQGVQIKTSAYKTEKNGEWKVVYMVPGLMNAGPCLIFHTYCYVSGLAVKLKCHHPIACGPTGCLRSCVFQSVMHDSDSGIGIDSGIIPILTGIGIGIGIKQLEKSWNRNRNRNQKN